jgi:hypothetical protein
MTGPLVKISTEPIADDRDHLFSIDGKDYYIPRELPGSLTVEAMAKATEIGDVPATMWIMERVLGADAIRALRACPTVRKEEILAIQEIIRNRVFGPAEQEGKG